MSPDFTHEAVYYRLSHRAAHDQRLIGHLGFQNRQSVGEFRRGIQPKLLPGIQLPISFGKFSRHLPKQAAAGNAEVTGRF